MFRTAAVATLDPVRDLFAEAGRAISDKTRDLNSVAVPEFVKSITANVEGALTGAEAFCFVANVTADIGTGLAAAGELANSAGDSIRRGFAAVAGQAEALRNFPGWVVPKPKRQSETAALLQEAIRKHDALIREVQTKNADNAERLEYLNRLVVQLKAVIFDLSADIDPAESDLLAVLRAQTRQIAATSQAVDANTRQIELSAARLNDGALHPLPVLRPWSELLAEAKADCVGVPTYDDVLSKEEQAAVRARLVDWYEEFYALHRLNSFDYAVAGVAGALGALADIFLVWVPSHPGFLGAPGDDGGWLSNVIKERFDDILPDDKVRALERAYKVPYDASTNFTLSETVAGLGPRTHRLHSLGHDPILGWIFGVRDIVKGEFTAVGKDGSFVVQSVSGWDPEETGVAALANVISAFRSVGGHMLSDVSTPAGLPPPLFALSQFFQFANISGHNIAEVARAMYRSGYDFRHFLAGGTCVALTEVIVRTSWTVRELSEGRTLTEALPVSTSPRLRTTLLLAHAVAAAVNAGKIAITQNPLTLNWAQWLALFRYLLPQLHWLLIERGNKREAFIRGKLGDDWADFNVELSRTWQMSFGGAPVVRL